MPPYFIDKGVGVQSFEDDRSSDQEIATIAAWVDSGSPQGDMNYLLPLHNLKTALPGRLRMIWVVHPI